MSSEIVLVDNLRRFVGADEFWLTPKIVERVDIKL